MPKKKAKVSKKLKLRIKINPLLKQRLSLLTGFILIFVGFLLISTYISTNFPNENLSFIPQKNQTNNVVQTGPIQIAPTLMKDENVSEEPIRIAIPSANIDINVVEAPVVNGYWETSDTTASHGMGSANPGQTGNTVIFAHARVGLFYNLKDLNMDDIIYVFTNKKWYAYKVTDITSVYPSQIEVIAPTKDQRLTLYTCTGYADNQRLIVVAKPIKIGS